MKKQQGFVGVGVLIAILVGLAVLGGGAYYVVHQQSTSQTASDNFDNVQTLPTTNNPVQTTTNTPVKTTQSQNTETQKATATIDKNSLTTSSAKPTITGTFSNTNGIEVIVTTGTLPPDGLMSAMVSQPIWSDRSDHGGGVMLNGTSAGTWSNTISTTLQNGTYRVGIYQDTLYYPQTDANLVKDSRHLLASGTLTVAMSQSTIVPDIIRITSPNGGETLKIGDTVRVSWDAKNVPGKYVGLRLEVWQISDNQPIIDSSGQCTNCTSGGMITLSNPVSSDGLANGAGSVDWVVGKKLYPLHTPPGPGNNYVLLAVAERGNTDEEAAECRQKNPSSVMCGKPWTVELGRDYSDRVFSITN